VRVESVWSARRTTWCPKAFALIELVLTGNVFGKGKIDFGFGLRRPSLEFFGGIVRRRGSRKKSIRSPSSIPRVQEDVLDCSRTSSRMLCPCWRRRTSRRSTWQGNHPRRVRRNVSCGWASGGRTPWRSMRVYFQSCPARGWKSGCCFRGAARRVNLQGRCCGRRLLD
jgi:hypothetical protein